MHKTESYKFFFSNNPAAMWVYDADSSLFLDVNDSAVELYGYDRNTFLTKTINEIVIADISPDFPDYELHKNNTGDLLWIKVKTSDIVYNDKSAKLSVLEDVTLKARIRKDLSRSEEKFRQIVNSAMDAIITVNAEQKIILFNKAAERMFGYTVEEITGKDLGSLIPSRFRGQHKVHINKFGETGTTNRKMGTLGTIYGVNSKGIEFPIEASISKVRHGEEKLFTVILRDVTERAEAEEVRDKFKQLADNLNDVFFITDAIENKTLYVSPSYDKVWERKSEHLVSGKEEWIDFIHPDDREKIIAMFIRQKNNGEIFSGEFRIITPDGKVKWIASKAFPVYNEKGLLYRYTGIAADISQRKNYEEKLKLTIRREKEANKTAEDAKGKLSFLAEASEILSSSLDYEETLTSVAALATPKFSDWCVVDILDEQGELNRLAVSHINPEKVKLAVELHKKYGPSKEEQSGVWHVIRRGESELYKEIPEELIREAARDEEHLRISLELGLKSGLIVPLKARGQIFGAITLIYAESDRYYDESDLHLIEDLAARAAIAIDNANLYKKAQLLNTQLDQKIEDLEIEIAGRKNIEKILIQNQEQLIQSDERLKAALNASETGTYRWNILTDTIEIDDALMKLLGLSPGIKLTHADYFGLVHPEDRDILKMEQEKSALFNKDFEFEYRVVWYDGSVHWLLDKGKFFSEEEGIPQYLTGACVDITYRKHAEQTLRDSEILFRQLAENIRDVFFVINPKNSNVIYVSPVFEDIWGMRREEIYLNPDKYYDVIHPDDRERFSELMKKAMTTGKYSAEFRIIRPDNTTRWLRSRGYPQYNENNELFRITGITEDITERKLAEEELHKSQEFLKSTVTSAPVILWVINNDCEVTLLEGRGLNQIGIEPGNNIGKKIFDIFKETREFKRNLHKAFNGKEISFTIQENGVWQEMRFSPLKNHAGNIQGVIGVAVDITQHKQAEEKILNSLKEKEILLKEIHHRVKNNLQIISSILSLQSSYIDDENIQIIFEESQNRVRSMALLHEKLYQTKDFTKINFEEYLEDLINNLFRSYQVKSDNIQLSITGDYINIDAEKAISIGLIINELISNSLKYAFKDQESGVLSIKFNKLTDQELKIVISDNGNGLPPDFDIRRTDTLGLQLINSLVEQLGGSIKVFNKKGANFEIILPNIAQT